MNKLISDIRKVTVRKIESEKYLFKHHPIINSMSWLWMASNILACHDRCKQGHALNGVVSLLWSEWVRRACSSFAVGFSSAMEAAQAARTANNN